MKAEFIYARGALRFRIKELERYQETANSRESRELQEEIDELEKAISLLSNKESEEEKDNSICKCTWPSCQYKSNCRNNRKAP